MLLNVCSPNFDPRSGYGRMTRELIRAMTARGMQVNAIGTRTATIDWGEGDDEGRLLADTPILPTMGGVLLGYPTLHPEYGELANMGPRVAVTMFESTRLPAGWVDALNLCDAVIVPTEEQAHIFRVNGVAVPIHAVPLGISDVYQPRTEDGANHHPLGHVPQKRGMQFSRLHYRRESHKPTARDPFIFLTWGDGDDRKGWDLAIRAFKIAFGDDSAVQLVIKTRRGGGGIPYEINVPGVQVIACDLTESQMNDLYLRADAMVWLARGEGFALPPREFAATGGQNVVTGWWADYAGRWAYPVRYEMVRAWQNSKDKRDLPLGEWAEADVEHAAEQMRHVYTQNPRLLAKQGERAIDFVRRHYRWETFAERVIELYEEVAHARA